MADTGGKTEKATPRRLEKAREDGQFASSREFVSAAQFLTFAAIFTWCGAAWFQELRSASRLLFEQAFAPDFGVTQVVRIAAVVLGRVFLPLGLAAAALMAVSLGFQMAVTRLGFSFKRLAPSGDKFDPLKKLRELPAQNLPALVQAACMLVFFAFAVYWIVGRNLDVLLTLPRYGLPTGLRHVSESIRQLLWRGGAILLLFGILDLVRQKRRHSKGLKMSKQEIKEEVKESEGDPQIKMRIRRLQRDLLRRGMMKKVPTATAVIVNPTHFAVAIRYQHDEMSTPVVVAKGKNYLALRIRKVAAAHEIPIVENPPLAQGLYKAVEVGQEIPPQFYKAVAEILAYIYRLMHPPAPSGRRPN
ncbi:MAG: EscU/YscU/HrcU family type III secretion system export apparatus switch protein [Acidobacteria bacterium]|nr:EscU/YscU/HrcU family type III secretion system export apparatus switch protein [Acidobacteriota bacterium]